MTKPVRTRIAPSPTGDPHVGTAYIALFDYVFAKQHNGQFILRIEDTDRTRTRQNSEQAIMESLRWIGLDWDEGPDKGGKYGPYRQSERKEIYSQYANELLEKGEAYRCFCTSERLSALREEQKKAKKRFGYDRHCRNISKEESDRRAKSEPYTIRLKMPLEGESVFIDKLRGEIKRSYEELDDQILLKSDGYPTYHLANVVDDHLMKITHVIRAEEWISSTPKHVRLYEAFGWEEPEWIHMPLLRNPDKNKSKISKRKNPVSLLYYKESGILPQALLNFLALMGFAIGNDIEKFTLSEMVENFSFDKVSLGGPVFDMEKLLWLNGLYMREIPENELLETIMSQWLNKDYFLKLMPLVQPRLKTLNDFVSIADFFFLGDLNYSKNEDSKFLIPKKRSPKEISKFLEKAVNIIDSTDDFTALNLEESMKELCQKEEWKIGDLFMPLRIAVTGKKASPPLFESMELVGRERTRRRIREAIKFIKSTPQK